MQTFVQGYLGAITINTEEWTVVANVLNFDRTKASLPKPTMGTQYRRTASGQISGTIQVDGHVSVEKLQAIETAFALETSVAYVLQIGAAAGATDAGSYTGNAVFTQLTVTGEAEGEFEFTATLETDGDISYTAPTP